MNRYFIFIMIIFSYNKIVAEIKLEPIELSQDCINITTDQGVKTGLWVKENSNRIETSYYSNGTKNGPSKIYEQQDSSYYLFCEKMYCNGQIKYIVYYHSSGYLEATITNIGVNTDFIDSQNKYFTGYVQPLRCYQAYISYYDNCGKIRAEGWLLSTDAEDYITDADFVGDWIIYTDSGTAINITEEEIHRTGFPYPLP